MDIFYSLAFSLVVIFNSVEMSSASSPPKEKDFISQLDQRTGPSSHQASSSHSNSAGEGLPETELRLNTNPGTYMHFHLDPNLPPAMPMIQTQLHNQVHLNRQQIPTTMLDCEKKEFNFMSGFQYWVAVEFEQRIGGGWIPKRHKAYEITPGNHQVEVNKYEEAVGYLLATDYSTYITYQGHQVALRWEHGKLGVRFLEFPEVLFIKKYGVCHRRN